MGRKRVSGSKGRDHRSQRGLKVKDRKGTLYVSGTVTVRGESVRIRQSTGLSSAAPGNWDRAAEICTNTEKEIQDQVIHGVKPSPRFGDLISEYLERHSPGQTDQDNIAELNNEFGDDQVSKLTKDRISAFYKRRFPWQSADTIRRHKATFLAILNDAELEELIDSVPKVGKTKRKPKRGRHMNKRFYAGEVELMIDCADKHIKPILATLLSTGARVSMTLILKREDFILAEGRGRVFFPDSKNGNAYSRPLHDYTVAILREWLDSRTDPYEEMFLTRKMRPYKIYPGRGGYIKAGYDKARDAAAAILATMGDNGPDRARFIKKSTPHWLRHNLANTLRQDMKADPKTIMEAGMWESLQVVIDHYFGDTEEATDTLVKSMPIGTKLTQRLADDG